MDASKTDERLGEPTMTKQQQMLALRNDPNVHYNCAQSVAIPFAGEMGLTPEQANRLMINFGGGMGCGSVCGALTGALFTMGGTDFPPEKRSELIEQFRAKFGSIDCGVLSAGYERGTPEMRELCDGFINFCMDWICHELNVE